VIAWRNALSSSATTTRAGSWESGLICGLLRNRGCRW